jgi:hypothetical protein
VSKSENTELPQGESRMKRDTRSLGIIFGALLMFFFTSNSGSPVMAEPDSASMDSAGVQRYRQVNQATLYEMNGEPLTFGSTFEVDLPSNGNRELDPEASETLTADTQMDVHRAELFFHFDKIGKISFGQGDTASSGVSEVDLSGTSIIRYGGTGDLADSIFFYDRDVAATLGARESDGGNGYLDNSDHKVRIRFDTPTFSGLGASFSTFADQHADYDAKSTYDAAIKYRVKAGDVDVAAAIAYSAHPSDQMDGRERLVNGSASVAFSGISFTFAAGNESLENDTHDTKKFYYGKAGYTMEFWNIGQTALAIDYGQYNDANNKADETKTMGFMFVQKLEDWSSEIYAGFRTHDLDHERAEYDAINAMIFGTRINF